MQFTTCTYSKSSWYGAGICLNTKSRSRLNKYLTRFPPSPFHCLLSHLCRLPFVLSHLRSLSVAVPLSLFLSVCVCLSVPLSVCVSFCISLSQSLCLCLSVCLPVSLSLCVWVSVSLSCSSGTLKQNPITNKLTVFDSSPPHFISVIHSSVVSRLFPDLLNWNKLIDDFPLLFVCCWLLR